MFLRYTSDFIHQIKKGFYILTCVFSTGFQVLLKDSSTAKDEFRKARDAAQMAFGVVADTTDKVLATKILVTSTFYEFNDNAETAKSLCCKYLERMNILPEVIRSCEMIFTPQKSLGTKILSINGKSKREDILQGVAEINKCVWVYLTGYFKVDMTPPVIRFDKYHINPITDMVLQRQPVLVVELEKLLSGFISVTMSGNYIFAALGQISGSTVTNDIIAINLSTKGIAHLLGHHGLVLSVCSNKTFLFSASYDRDILVWNIDTLKPIKKLSGHTGSVRSLCLSDTYLFSGSSDTTIRVWDYYSNDMDCIKQLEISQAVSHISCSRRKFLFCLKGAGNVQIWDVTKFIVLHELNTNTNITNIIANDSHMYLPTKSKDGHFIQCWNLGSLTFTANIQESGQNITKYYNAPYLFCGNDRIKMVSVASQKLITEQNVVLEGRRVVSNKIKYIWMNDCELFVLCETSTGRNLIVKY